MDSANGTAPQRLPPKKVRPTGKKMNRYDSSFCRKVSQAHAAARTSRERRPAHWTGSTVALEYQSQEHPARGQKRGLPQELVGGIQGRGKKVERNPHGGRHRATGLYGTRPVSSTTQAQL